MKTLLLAALLSAVILPPTAAAAPGQSPPRDGHVLGELIVRFQPGLQPAERRDTLHDGGARLERTLSIPRTALVRGSGDARDALERDPRVASVERNVYRHGTARPNDAFFPWMWGLDNTGQAVGGQDGLADADIDAPEAWERTTGSADIKVAVLDSGIAFGQPDLAANLWRNPGESGAGRETNRVDDDGNGYVDDWRGWDFIGRDNEPSDNYGHGTHVAGTIAARGNDGVGVTGVAWRASIVPVRVLNNDNAGSCADLAEGMAYAVKAGARVVNVSIGSAFACQLERDVIESASNTLFVTSAGNEGQDLDQTPAYPCSLPSANVVCVAATDSRDRLPDWSNRGARSVDLAAPGVNVLSTIVRFEPQQVVYATGFENGLDWRWDTGGWPDTWQTTSQTWRRSGAFSLSNSALGWYVDNTDSWARLSLDMTPWRDCYAKVWRRFSLGPILPHVPGEAHDVIWAETSTDGNDWSHYTDGRIGANSTFDPWWVELSELEGRATGKLRFRLAANAQDTYDGVAVDDLVVYCIPPVTTYTGAHEDNELYDGTSMAAPHVSGVAALMLSLDPSMTAGKLKQRLLATVDPLPSLAGKTVTGGRLNAARAVDLPPKSSPPGGGAAPPRPAGLRSRMAAALEADLKTIAKRLRRRGLVRVRVNALTAGRFMLRLDSASGVTVATGSCARRRAGRCALRPRPMRRVRPFRRVTVELAFKPRSGRALVRRARVTLPTRKDTPR